MKLSIKLQAFNMQVDSVDCKLDSGEVIIVPV